MASLYSMKIEELKGVGKKRGELFHKLGVFSAGQLICFYPRAYEDWSDITEINKASDGQQVCIKATIGSPFSTGYTKSGKYIAKTTAYDDSGIMELVFLCRPWKDT